MFCKAETNPSSRVDILISWRIADFPLLFCELNFEHFWINDLLKYRSLMEKQACARSLKRTVFTAEDPKGSNTYWIEELITRK